MKARIKFAETHNLIKDNMAVLKDQRTSMKEFVVVQKYYSECFHFWTYLNKLQSHEDFENKDLKSSLSKYVPEFIQSTSFNISLLLE